MNPLTFAEVPGWSFEVREVSMNVYHVEGRDVNGRSIEKTGTDPEKVLTECYQYARDLLEVHQD